MAMLVKATVCVLFIGLSLHVPAEVDTKTDEDNKPSIELLEFLGQWTDEDGDEVELEMLEDARFPAIRHERAYDRLRR